MTAATATELWRMSATELSEVIRTRRASSAEVVEAHLRRTEAVNPAINAIVLVLGEQALQAAEAADRAVAAGAGLPPFHGVPFTIKDIIDVAGTPTTQGFKALAQAYPSQDAPIVERMKAAGAIPMGRTNLPSGAVRWHTDSELWGATINPWDRTRTPGASSAGEAAAIATGMSPMGLGSDGLRSLRHPAQCCGIAALKPTLGRIPHATTIEPEYAAIGMQLTGVYGPLARRTADRGTSGGHRGRSSASRAGDRSSLPRRPVPGRRWSDRGPARHHHADRSEVRTMSRAIDRLTSLDRLMLGASKRWPQDVGALVILDGKILLDPAGELRIDAVREAISSRLHLVPGSGRSSTFRDEGSAGRCG